MRRFVSILLLFPLLHGCVALVESRQKMADTLSLLEVDYSGKVLADIPYSEGLCYDIYLPEIRADKAGTLFLFVHGGGWTSGSKEDGMTWSRYFASKGYTAASLDYSLQTKQRTPSIDAMVAEMHGCIRSAIERASQEGIVLERLVLNGYSAGGCLALLYAYREEPELPLCFVITQSAPVSFDPGTWESGVHWYVNRSTGVDGSTKGAAAFVSRMSGKTVTASMVEDGSARTIWEAISPVSQLDPSDPPTLLGYGLTDGVVPRGHKDILIERLEETGVPYEYVPFPHSGHALAYDLDCQEAFLRIVDIYCGRYLD